MALHPLKRSHALSEQFPTAILDSLSEAVVVVDGGGLVHYANLSAEQFFGVGRARIVGHPLSEFMPDDTPLFSLLEQVLATGERRSAQKRLPMRGEESVTPFSATAPPVANTCSSREKSGVSSGMNSLRGWPTMRARPTPKNCSAERLA